MNHAARALAASRIAWDSRSNTGTWLTGGPQSGTVLSFLSRSKESSMDSEHLPPPQPDQLPKSRPVHVAPADVNLVDRRAQLRRIAAGQEAISPAQLRTLRSSGATTPEAPISSPLELTLAAELDRRLAAADTTIADAGSTERERPVTISIGRVDVKGDHLDVDVGLALKRALRKLGIIASDQPDSSGPALQLVAESDVSEQERNVDSSINLSWLQYLIRSRRNSNSIDLPSYRFQTSRRIKIIHVHVTVTAERSGASPLLEDGVGEADRIVVVSASTDRSSGGTDSREDMQGDPQAARREAQRDATAQATAKLAAKLVPHLRAEAAGRVDLTLNNTEKKQPNESDSWPKQWVTIEGAQQLVASWLSAGKRAPVNVTVGRLQQKIGEIEQAKGDQYLIRVNPTVSHGGRYKVTIPPYRSTK